MATVAPSRVATAVVSRVATAAAVAATVSHGLELPRAFVCILGSGFPTIPNQYCFLDTFSVRFPTTVAAVSFPLEGSILISFSNTTIAHQIFSFTSFHCGIHFGFCFHTIIARRISFSGFLSPAGSFPTLFFPN